MFVLGVGGLSSGVGKTALICRLATALPGWGALKTSLAHAGREGPSRGRHAPEGPFQVIDEPSLLGRAGSDTARFSGAGFTRVSWLRSHVETLGVAIEDALERFSGLAGVVVEGNSFAAHRPPDAMVVVARAGLDEVKPSAYKTLAGANWLVFNRAGRDDVRPEVERLQERLRGNCTAPVITLDAESLTDPGTQQLLDEVRVFFRE